MAARALRECLAQDLGSGLTDGLISKETHDSLRLRYRARSFGRDQALKYLGISGGLLAFFGLLGFVGAMAASEAVVAFLLLAVGAGLTAAGIRLSVDLQGRYGVSSSIALALGLVATTLGVGVYHELRLRERSGRFFQAHQAAGRVYLNLSLLILSCAGWEPSEMALVWVVVFTLAAIGHIVLGARLHNGLFTGSGVTAFAINLYTRYFEHSWNRTHAGVFFLMGGLSRFGAGLGCELLVKRTRIGAA